MLVYAASFDTYSTEDIGRHWSGRDGAAPGHVTLEREGRQDGYFVAHGADACVWRPLGVDSLPLNPAELASYVVGFRFRTPQPGWTAYEHSILSLTENATWADSLVAGPSSVMLKYNEGWGQLYLEYNNGYHETRPGSMVWELTGVTTYYSVSSCRTLYTGRWHYIELMLNAATREVTVRLDGAVELSTRLTEGALTPPVTHLILGSHNTQWGNTRCEYDDLYVATIDDGFLGPCRVVPVLPKQRTHLVFPGDPPPPPTRWVPVNAPDTLEAVRKLPFDSSSYARLPAVTPREQIWTPGGVGSTTAPWRFAEYFDFEVPLVWRDGKESCFYYQSCMARTDQAGDYVATTGIVVYRGHPTIPDGTVSGFAGYGDRGFQNPATGSWKEYGVAETIHAMGSQIMSEGFGGLSGARDPGFAFNTDYTPYGNVDVAQLVLEVLVPDDQLPPEQLEAVEPVSTVFVASDSGLWRKLAGADWERVYAGACTKVQGPFFQKPRAHMRHRGPQTLVLQAAAGWFKSTDHGTTWAPLPLPAGIGAGNVRSIAFMDQDHARALMLVSGLPTGTTTQNGLYTCFDALAGSPGFAGWFQKYRPPPGAEYTDVVGCELLTEGEATYVMAGHKIGDPTPWSTPPLPGNDREMGLVGRVYEGTQAEWPLPLYGRPGGPLTADNQGGTPSLGRLLHYSEQHMYVFYQDSAAPLTMSCYYQNTHPGGSRALTLSSDCTPDRSPFNTGRPRWVAGTGYRKYAHWLDPSTSRGGIYRANRLRDWVLAQPPTGELFVPINHGAPSLAIDREESRIVYVLGATTLWTSLDDGVTWASAPAPWTGPRCIFTLEPYPQGRGTGP